ncbi:Zinc transporter ZIP9 [Echinococcus granulosus]|uniref:Zinc transporter ZIP9 n=1 Tax=Echinococcus granulosus TaxID=6210 RepID=W6UN83_ECHGR|nr:Zinc transporter ZIP9 [Echinococcus granulosus]EUB62593.1 Zinc transporter ZIP9 [Echinococcus granulosus]
MFVGCYAAGYIPLAFNYSPHNLRLVTIFGAGLLVGAALAIIIPEGVATIYGIQKQHMDHSSIHEVSGLEARHLNQLEPVKQNVPLPDVEPVPLPPAAKKVEETVPTTTISHGLIGLALTMGFVLMFLVDHLGNETFCQACTRPLFSVFHCFSCQRRSNDLILPTTSDGEGAGLSSPSILSSSSPAAALAAVEHSAKTTTLGLVVHSFADGLAIGAAFGLTLDLTLILFIAIMLHKASRLFCFLFFLLFSAPAAFGFVSFLVHEGLPRNRIKVYLLAFALASPVGALLTYLVVTTNAYIAAQQAGFFVHLFLFHPPSLSPVLSMGVTSTPSTGTGFALLLSGGTFLYVATAHILPHLNTEKPISSGSLNGSSHHRHQNTTFKPVELIAFVLGSCVPVLISFGHSH